MDVILLEKIRNLGALGDTVNVRAGYARNFLIPYGKAVYATESNVARFAKERAHLEALAKEKLEKAAARQALFAALSEVVIVAKASQEGKLFGSVGTREIAEAISEKGVAVEKKEVRLSSGIIRAVGSYDVLIDLDSDMTATVKLVINAEE